MRIRLFFVKIFLDFLQENENCVKKHGLSADNRPKMEPVGFSEIILSCNLKMK